MHLMRRMFDIRLNRLDDRGHRLVEVELAAARTHPRDIARVLGFEPQALLWRASHGEVVREGRVDLVEPVIRLDFSPQDPQGIWEIKVASLSEAGRKRRLWVQDVYVQGPPRVPPQRAADLALRHAPIFVFGDEEEHFPVSLHTLFHSPEVRSTNTSLRIRTIFGKERVAIARLGEFMRFNGHRDYLLDFDWLSANRSVYATLGSDPGTATVYWSYAEDPHSERFFITYHLIYAFDTKVGLARKTGVGPHVFDRESMVLVFDGDQRPTSMVLSGHLEDQTVFFLHKLKAWSQGRVVLGWDDPQTLKLGQHPVIAVAEGSHALYPTSGVYRVSFLQEVAGHLNLECLGPAGRAEALSPDQLLAPPGVRVPGLPPYGLVPLDLANITSHMKSGRHREQNAYLAFSGFWVDVPGPRNARFPPFTRKVAEIVDWVDGAYPWDWDDLPEIYKRNNQVILQYLQGFAG